MGVRTPHLADLTKRLFETLPPYYRGDDTTEAVIDATAREAQRIADFLERFRFKSFPQNADDEFRSLGIWEQRLGLPVEPVGITLESRRQLVLARLRGRNASSGKDWVAAMTLAMGANAWSYDEDAAAAQVTILIPFVEHGFTTNQVLALANAIIPAHIEVLVGYEEGWLVGIANIGTDTL